MLSKVSQQQHKVTKVSVSSRCSIRMLSRASEVCGVGYGRCKVVIINPEHKPKLEQIFKCQRPVIFRELAKNWPAIKWLTEENHLRKRLELSDDQDVVVPMEFGHYMQENHLKAHVGLSSVLDTLDVEMSMEQEDAKNAFSWYVAQHEVKDISTTLLEDLITPDLVLKTGKQTVYRSNIWLNGASGASSPCHQDPFNNMLVQLHGEKIVTLYDNSSTEALYPAIGTVQKNTSLIDFSQYEDKESSELLVDREKYPKYYQPGLKTQYGPCVIRPGDALYIPYKYWHYCRSRGTSLSVNWWWL